LALPFFVVIFPEQLNLPALTGLSVSSGKKNHLSLQTSPGAFLWNSGVKSEDPSPEDEPFDSKPFDLSVQTG